MTKIIRVIIVSFSYECVSNLVIKLICLIIRALYILRAVIVVVRVVRCT